jgi:hypothetical protein
MLHKFDTPSSIVSAPVNTAEELMYGAAESGGNLEKAAELFQVCLLLY